MRFLLVTMGGAIDTEHAILGSLAVDHDGGSISQATNIFDKILHSKKSYRRHKFYHEPLGELGAKTIRPEQYGMLASLIRAEQRRYHRIIVTMHSAHIDDFGYRMGRLYLAPLPCPVIATGAEGPDHRNLPANAEANMEMAAFDRPQLIPNFYAVEGESFDSDVAIRTSYKPSRLARSYLSKRHLRKVLQGSFRA